MDTCIFPFIHALKIRKVQSFVRAFVCGSIETKGMPTRIRTILNPLIFYPDSRGLAALKRFGERFRWADSLVSCGRKADSCEKVRGFKNIRIRVTLGTRGFSRVRWEFSVLAEGRHIFGRRPKPPEKLFARVTIKTWQKPETALEKSLASRVDPCGHLFSVESNSGL